MCFESTIIVNLGHFELDRDYGKWTFFSEKIPECLDTGLEPGITIANRSRG